MIKNIGWTLGNDCPCKGIAVHRKELDDQPTV